MLCWLVVLLGAVNWSHAATTTYTEDTIVDLVNLYNAGELSWEELHDTVEELDAADKEAASALLDDLERHSTTRLLHRRKRDLAGSMHFKMVTAERLTKASSILKRERGVESRSFVLGPSSGEQVPLILIDRQIHQISHSGGDDAIVALDCPTCTLDYGQNNQTVVYTEVAGGLAGASEAYVSQAVLHDLNAEGKYMYSSFILSKINGTGSTVETSIIRDIQMTLLNPPLDPAQSLSRISLMEFGQGSLLIASFQRNRDQMTASGMHLLWFDNTWALQPLAHSELLLDNDIIREYVNDIKLVKIFGEERILLVVARREVSYVFAVNTNQFEMSTVLVQKVCLADPERIEYEADSLGSYLTFVQSSGEVNTFLWDAGRFVLAQTYAFPHLAAADTYSWHAVSTATTLQLPIQSIIVTSNTTNLKFLHHTMPGVYAELDDPIGTAELIEDCIDDCYIVDMGRNLNNLDKYRYYFLLYDDGGYRYVSLSLDLVEHYLVDVNDASVCLWDLSNSLSKDYEYHLKIENLTSDVVPGTTQDFSSYDFTIDRLTAGGSLELGLVNLNLQSEHSPSIEDVDYNDPTSQLAVNVRSVDSNATEFVYASIACDGREVAPSESYVLNVPRLEITKAAFEQLAVGQLGSIAVADILNNSLRLTGDQNISVRANFDAVLNASSVEIMDGAASQDPLTPDTYFSLTDNTQFDKEVSFTGSVIMTGDMHIVTTINDVAVADILTENEIDASSAMSPIAIYGVKDFKAGFSAMIVHAESVNGRNYVDWLNSLLFIDEALQTVTSDRFSFRNLTVLESFTVDLLAGQNISAEALADIVRTDSPAIITANITYFEDIETDDLITSSLNDNDPADLLISGKDQEILIPVGAEAVEASSVTSHNINSICLLTQAAKTEDDNVFEEPVWFDSTVILSQNMDLADGVSLAGLDPSEIGELDQVYTEEVTVTGTLSIADEDLAVGNISVTPIPGDLDSNSVEIDNFTIGGIVDLFIVVDKRQTLPNLAVIAANVTFNEFHLIQTLDNLDVWDDILHTSGDQTIQSSNIVFNRTTYFEDSVLIRDPASNATFNPEATIAGINIRELDENVFCHMDPSTLPFMGTLRLHGNTVATSYFDIDVNNNLKFNKDGSQRDMGKIENTAALVSSSNRFSQEMTLTGGLEVNGDYVSNDMISAGRLDTTLNGQVFNTFMGSIVNNDANVTVTTPVFFEDLIGNAIIHPNSSFDGVDLEEQLRLYVLLDDDAPIRNTLVNNEVSVAGGTVLDPEDGDTEYFAQECLADYLANHLLQKGDEISGDKTLEGTLTVQGLMQVNSENNTNHPLGVNMQLLQDEALSKTTTQTITDQVTMGNLKARSIYTNEVNGIELSNLCLRDENCHILASTDQPTIIFESSVTVPGNIDLADTATLDGVTAAARWSKLVQPRPISSITNLTVDGDMAWTTALIQPLPTITDLLENLVVRSDKDWSLQDQPDYVQPVTGATNFTANVTVGTLDLETGLIAIDAASAPFNYYNVLNDSARLEDFNVFNCSKTFTAGVSVTRATLDKLADTAVVNGVDLAEFLDAALVRTIGGDNQTVTGSWNMLAGFNVTNRLAVSDQIDGVEVEDFVRKSTHDTRPIPAVTVPASSVGTVTGNLVSSTDPLVAQLDTFFNTSVRLSQPANFTQAVTFTDLLRLTTVTAVTVNGMAVDNMVRTGTADRQVITQALVLNQTVDVYGNLSADSLEGFDPEVFNAEILRLDREETITNVTKIVFEDTVIIDNERIQIEGRETELDSLVSLFLDNLEAFTADLLRFYEDNIVQPIRGVMEELYVAKRIGVARFNYLERLDVDDDLNLDNTNFTVLGLDSLCLGNGEMMLMVERGYSGTDCPINTTAQANCYCNNTRIVTGSANTDYEVYDRTEKVFNFKLNTGVFTVTTAYRGYSEQCQELEAEVNVTVTGTLLDTAASDLDLKSISAEKVGSVMTPFSLAGNFQVKDVQMFEIGGQIHLAIAPGYTETPDTTNTNRNYFLLYRFDNGQWSERNLAVTPQNEISIMSVSSFRVIDNEDPVDVVHLYIVEEVADDLKMVNVWQWRYRKLDDNFLETESYRQAISSPGVTALDVVKVQPTKETSQQIVLSMAVRMNRALVTSTYLLFYQYDYEQQEYASAFLPDMLTLLGTNPVNKMKSRKLSMATDVLFISTDQGVGVYIYQPNRGIRLASMYEVEGRLVDMAVYEEVLPRSTSKDKSTTMLYILSELLGERKTEVICVQLKGKIDLPEVVFTQESEPF